MDKQNDKKIIQCWEKNFQPWISAIEQKEIESRQLVTNKAIVDTVLQKHPKSVLDIGCGEGWLVRELQNANIDALGIDIIPEFIDYASKFNSGRFRCLAYDALNCNNLPETFDLLVCNFSLLGHKSVESVFKNSTQLLNHNGYLVIQTLHPNSIETDITGWRPGSWDGFNNDFRDPAPWYYRTMDNWQQLFKSNGFNHLEVHEPLSPATHQPASIIFIGHLDAS